MQSHILTPNVEKSLFPPASNPIPPLPQSSNHNDSRVKFPNSFQAASELRDKQNSFDDEEYDCGEEGFLEASKSSKHLEHW